MIPLSLHLRDFLSYGPEGATLDFAPLELAVLAGPNGAGKSALFDALTWALWGKARCRNENLVRWGAEAAEVEFRFELNAERYRIVRRFQAHTGKHDAAMFRMTGGTEKAEAQGVRNVAEAVARLLRLPYESFVASVYFKQGEAAYFTRTLSPRHRKELLFSLLGLDSYLKLGETAARAGREIKSDRDRIEAAAAPWAEESRAREFLRGEVAAARAALAAAENEARARADALATAREAEANLRARILAGRDLRARHERVERDQEEARRRAQETAAALEAAERLLALGPVLQKDLERALAARARMAELEARAATAAGVQEALRALRTRADERKHVAGRALATAEERARLLVEEERRLRQISEQTPALEAAAAALPDIEGLYNELKARERKSRALEKEVAEAQAALDHARTHLAETTANLRKARPEKRGAEENLRTARARADAQAEVVRAAAAERAAREAACRAREGAEARLEAARRDEGRIRHALAKLRDHLEDVDGDAAACPTCGRPFDPRSREETRTHLRAEETLLAKELAAAEAGAAAAEKELADRSEHMIQLAAAEESVAAAAAVAARYARDLVSAEQENEEYGRLGAELKSREEELAALEAGPLAGAARDARRRLQEMAPDPSALAAAEAKHGEVREARARLEGMKETGRRLRALPREIAMAQEDAAARREALAGDFLNREERAELTRLERTLAATTVDPAELAAVRVEVDTYAAAESRRREAERAAAAWPALTREADKAARRVEQLGADLSALQNELAAIAGLEAASAECAETLARAEERAREAAAEVRQVSERLGAARAAEARAQEAHARFQTAQTLLRERDREIARDEYLARAFGPDGIPALMAERAFDELEAAANDYLGRLSGGRMTLYLQTQRETKTAGLAETLDVILMDRGRARPYESFSGGEAFRADFALRLGLSRLLARRAGVPLRFLVVDEGFGTQDEEGLAALLEVIAAVRSEFAVVIVISHLPALRDVFPARVEVYQDHLGFSRLRPEM